MKFKINGITIECDYASLVENENGSADFKYYLTLRADNYNPVQLGVNLSDYEAVLIKEKIKAQKELSNNTNLDCNGGNIKPMEETKCPKQPS